MKKDTSLENLALLPAEVQENIINESRKKAERATGVHNIIDSRLSYLSSYSTENQKKEYSENHIY